MGKKWTKEDTELLREIYGQPGGKEKLKLMLPQRSWEAIRIRASKLGISRPAIPWIEEEDQILCELYSQSLYGKKWTQKDDELIRKYYNQKGGKEKLMQLLPDHTRAAIRVRAGKLGIAREKDMLRRLPRHSWEAIKMRAQRLRKSK